MGLLKSVNGKTRIKYVTTVIVATYIIRLDIFFFLGFIMAAAIEIMIINKVVLVPPEIVTSLQM